MVTGSTSPSVVAGVVDGCGHASSSGPVSVSGSPVSGHGCGFCGCSGRTILVAVCSVETAVATVTVRLAVLYGVVAPVSSVVSVRWYHDATHCTCN